MKYYVVSDVHGFYTELIEALTEAGFFKDEEEKIPHKLIVCGDMMDRGLEAVKMQEFMLDLHKKGELIFIRGNHEDLMLAMLDDIIDDFTPFVTMSSYHIRNGTLSTAAQLNGINYYSDFIDNPRDFVFKARQSTFVKELIPVSVDYYETENYIFVHGWIPVKTQKDMPAHHKIGRTYEFDPDWRNADTEGWNTARWLNGMAIAELNNIREPGKTIVCGHWHTSFGHSVLAKKCSEFGEDADFSPYYGKGIIAIDACTAHTKKINCLVIED